MRIVFLILFLSISFNAWTLDLNSPSFRDGDYIPSRYTCDSLDISPTLIWQGIPPGTQSFVLICDDADAPAGDWVHWIIFNIPAKTKTLTIEFKPVEGGVYTDTLLTSSDSVTEVSANLTGAAVNENIAQIEDYRAITNSILLTQYLEDQ